MKSNCFTYDFIIFIVVLLLFAIYKIRKDEEEKQVEQTQANSGQDEKITEDIENGKEVTLMIHYDGTDPQEISPFFPEPFPKFKKRRLRNEVVFS